MQNIAVQLSRRPVLTVLIAYAVAFGVAALIVTCAEKRDTTCNPGPGQANHRYLASQTLSSTSSKVPV